MCLQIVFYNVEDRCLFGVQNTKEPLSIPSVLYQFQKVSVHHGTGGLTGQLSLCQQDYLVEAFPMVDN